VVDDLWLSFSADPVPQSFALSPQPSFGWGRNPQTPKHVFKSMGPIEMLL